MPSVILNLPVCSAIHGQLLFSGHKMAALSPRDHFYIPSRRSRGKQEEVVICIRNIKTFPIEVYTFMSKYSCRNSVYLGVLLPQRKSGFFSKKTENEY